MTVISRCSLIACALLSTACAGSSPSVSGRTQDVRFDSDQGRYNFEFVQDRLVTYDTLAIVPTRAWSAIGRAYDAAGLTGTLAREGTLTYGVPRATVRRSLGGVRLSRLLRCGETMGVPNADNYNITLSVISRLTAAGPNRTVIESQVQAHALQTGTASNALTCVSTTELEKRLARLLEYYATRPAS